MIIYPVRDQMLQPGPLVGWLLPSLAMCTLTDRLLSVALRRREAAGTPERLLADSGTRLLQARTEAQVAAIAVDTVSCLLADRSAEAIAVLLTSADGPEVLVSRPADLAAPAPGDLADNARVAVLPLPANRGAATALYVDAGRPLPTDVRSSLDTLAGQLALCLEVTIQVS